MPIGNRLKQDVVAEDVVIRLRPCTGSPPSARGATASTDYLDPCRSAVPDLARYECREGDDDFGHRMVVNVVALACTSVLILAGLQLVTMMAHG